MAYIYYFICLLLSSSYLFIILGYIKNWSRLDSWYIPDNYTPKTKISVLVPIRNEEENIKHCIESILAQDYPNHLYEVIFIDDHSQDKSKEIIESYRSSLVKVLSLSQFNLPDNFNSYKKFGLSKAIEMASGDLIVTTDGDCAAPKKWLSYFSSFHEIQGKTFIAAPVNFSSGTHLIQHFQELDFIGMMLITGASIQAKKGYMCNGANLAYTKDLFLEVDGFENINHIASGDDMLLMHKIARKNKSKIGFIKNADATVFSKSKENWSSFKTQRLRWASKSNSYDDKNVLLSLILVFLFHLSLITSLILIPFAGMTILVTFLLQILIKYLADNLLLSRASTFFKNESSMRFFFPAMLIHIYYIAYIGILSNFKRTYEWKGRSVK